MSSIRTRSILFIVFNVFLFTDCSKNDPATSVCYLTSSTLESSFGTDTETLTYDDKNRVISITSSSSGGAPLVSTYSYGSNGNLATATFFDGSTATYTFDSQNRMILQTNSDGSTVTVSYNASGQPTSRVIADPNCATCGGTITYTYPNTTTHNYTSESFTSNSGTPGSSYASTFEYDNHPNPYKPVLYSSTGTDNNVTKQVYTSSTSNFTSTTTYTYNDRGYPITKTFSDGGTVSYTYNCP